MKKVNALISVSCIALLSACLGGGGGGGGSSNSSPGSSAAVSTAAGSSVPSEYTREKLDSSAAKTSTLGGAAVYRDANGDSVKVVETTGTLTHNTGKFTLQNDNLTLEDENGNTHINGETDYSDSNNGSEVYLSPYTVGARKGDYEYVLPSSHLNYTRQGLESYDGVVGVLTDPSDVPNSASARYTGHSEAYVKTVANNGAVTESNLRGTSRVDANFATGSVNVSMSDFGSFSKEHDLGSIKARNMEINGNRFSGGTIKTYDNAGAEVNLTGANTKSQAAGAFFGYDSANSIPDEVGGVVNGRGDSGQFSGTFIAD